MEPQQVLVQDPTPLPPLLHALHALRHPSLSSDQRRLLLAEIKQLHREVNLHMDKTNEDTMTAKLSLDALALQYNRLVREKEYVMKEMHICRESIKFEQHDLVDPDVFMEQAPDYLRTPEILQDPHRLYMARLVFEENQRRELMSQFDRLKQRKKELISSNEVMQSFLDSIPVHLERVIKAALPLKRHAGLPNTVILPDPKMENLCQPLYTLYVALCTYTEVFQDNLIDVRIEICSDALSVSADGVEFKLHPYSIFVTVKEPNISVGLDLVFSALYPGPIIFVKGGSNILTDLYSNDDTSSFPNAMQQVVDLSNTTKELSAIGTPYKWASALCGIYQHRDHTPTIRSFIALIRDRMANHVQLQRHISALESLEIRIPPSLSNKFPFSPRSKLSSFTCLSPRSFENVFQHNSGCGTITVISELHPDYPHRLPSVQITVSLSDPDDKFETIGEQIQFEVDSYFQSDSRFDSVLLPYLLRHIQMLFDISMCAIGRDVLDQPKQLLRFRRGRDRRLPLYYDERLELFRPR